jgi:hypothetical protein
MKPALILALIVTAIIILIAAYVFYSKKSDETDNETFNILEKPVELYKVLPPGDSFVARTAHLDKSEPMHIRKTVPKKSMLKKAVESMHIKKDDFSTTFAVPLEKMHIRRDPMVSCSRCLRNKSMCTCEDATVKPAKRIPGKLCAGSGLGFSCPGTLQYQFPSVIGHTGAYNNLRSEIRGGYEIENKAREAGMMGHIAHYSLPERRYITDDYTS